MPEETTGASLTILSPLKFYSKLFSLATEEIKIYMTIGQPQTSTNLCLLFRTVPKETTGASSIQEKVEKKPSFISAARVARGLGLKR